MNFRDSLYINQEKLFQMKFRKNIFPISHYGNGIKQYSLFDRFSNSEKYYSFTTNSSSGNNKIFDTTISFDIRNIFLYWLGTDISIGSLLSNNFAVSYNTVNMSYTINGVTNDAITSVLVVNKPVFIIFDKTTVNGVYRLKAHIIIKHITISWQYMY